jgi:hypothetical protein
MNKITIGNGISRYLKAVMFAGLFSMLAACGSESNNTDASTAPEEQTPDTQLEDQTPDTTPPVLTLNGDASISLKIDSDYQELGATAQDDTDGPLTVTVTGEVNINVLDT